MRPLFLFSLPRSGSTLIQRILASHAQIATTAEPWILLPILYSLRERGAWAEYGHELTTIAVKEFCCELPNGVGDYLAEIREFALRLYARASSNGATYFLDKTPRYHLIVRDIIRIFDQGKFIFLWRNPLAVAASIIDTWGYGKWNLYDCHVDLFDGLANLVEAFESNRERVCALKYETLVTEPEKALGGVFEYLELPFRREALSEFVGFDLKGQMGDHEGRKRYQSISEEPLEKWRSTMANSLRKAWCRHYIRWIGGRRLAVMGYHLDELLHDLDRIPAGWKSAGSDALRRTQGYLTQLLRSQILGKR